MCRPKRAMASKAESSGADHERLARAEQPAQDAMRLHPFYRGKVQTMLKCPVRDYSDFAVWYTPGVAAPCKAIQRDGSLVYEHTNKGNTIAVVSDGSRVLGLGDIGPEAGLPVMEGKALLFKFLGGVDAVPICIGTRDPDEIIRTTKLLEPSFGGINLEDLSQPKCFDVLDKLQEEMNIPVWHDDQQGSATVLVAGLLNALKLTGRTIRDVKVAMVGMGAANVATYRLITRLGVDPAGVVACDSKGVLHQGRDDIEAAQDRYRDKWNVCRETNAEGVVGGILEALRGADVCIAFSSPGPRTIEPEWIEGMAKDAIVFACANPIPEIWPWEASQAGARIVATGRSDFPNQVNNSLCFPAIFRGALDVRARTITDEMALAAAERLAQCSAAGDLNEESLLPRMDQWEVFPRVAVATAMKAQAQGVARLEKTEEQLSLEALEIIGEAQRAVRLLMDQGLIKDAPST